MKTLQECKDEVARNHDYPRWGNLLHDLLDGNVPIQFIEECEDEAAELYGSAKWHQACDEILKEFERLKDKASTVRDAIYLDGVMAVIDDSVKKEFKP